MQVGSTVVIFFSTTFGSLLAKAEVTGSSSVKCGRSFRDWVENSRGQTPCLVYADLYSTCAMKGTTMKKVPPLPKLDPNATYPAPSDDLECMCNTVAYDLISACAVCQHKSIITWPQWAAKCEPNSTLIGRFPRPTPNCTDIPDYAYWDPTIQGSFNASAAQSFRPQGSTHNSDGNSTGAGIDHGDGNGRNDASAGNKNTITAIVGGVLGGALGLLLILLLICHTRKLLRKKDQPSRVLSLTDSESNSIIPAPHNLDEQLTTVEPQPNLLYSRSRLPIISRIYDPTDPSTYPPDPANSYSNLHSQNPPPPSYEAHTPRDHVTPPPEMAQISQGKLYHKFWSTILS
ncbi:hypothetical protein BOTBODRAFT_56181 [Botryobasidium botryosum FD-172 SS1]|uniref:Uncharacterized protein n=1 Tax=Botryobasidium botryosum (strain FD-172 SS1) TaxID=930990 RepID=A0A067MP85_BOTB1|nr:hypothetical protein BOTBODRAFT_56181 [Botryobasidium botryosum FD-172 SS1]